MTADGVLQQQQKRSPTILEAHRSFIAVKVVPNERVKQQGKTVGRIARFHRRVICSRTLREYRQELIARLTDVVENVMRLDPVEYAILSQSLIAVAREMGAKLVRSAYSTILREARDGSAALIDVRGQTVAQAEL